MITGFQLGDFFQLIGFGGLAIAIVRAIPALKKIANEREANLLSERFVEMEGMRARLNKLEEGRDTDRKDFEAKLESERGKHDRETRRYRHRVNNLQQAFDALLLLLEQIPEAAPVVAKVKEMRARQLEAEALEAGGMSPDQIARTA